MVAGVCSLMNDPHVEALHYRFISEDPSDLFDKAHPLAMQLGDFEVELRGEKLAIKPLVHYATQAEAKAAVEPYLRSWESAAFLSPSRFQIRFKFESANVIDRDPDPHNLTISLSAAAVGVSTARATLTRSMSKFPAPDVTFLASKLTDELIDRIKRYRDGREPLASMAYWMLNRLEKEYGGRQQISRELKVHKDVLQELGRLSETSDPEHGRKAKPHGGPTRLTQAQVKWLDETIVQLVRRVGEVSANVNSRQQLSMRDLPPI